MAHIHSQRQQLPAYKHRLQLLYAIENHSTTIIVGEPGSGKSTQLPQYLHEAGWTSSGKMIACTQPRRVAAAMLARRVSEEMNVELGTTVGYSVRFTEASDPLQTRIKFLTDGTLIRECMSDPLLSCYSVIMIDEAQDRSIATDTLLALLKKIIAKRKDDFRVVISSASLDAEQFRKYFDDSVIVSISGQMFPVDIHYLQTPCENYLIAAIETVISIHKQELPGDILVFLPGKDDILAAISEIKEHLLANRRLESLLALPMYSGLSPKDQKPVFDAAPAGMRKVVFATNVAETSVTIDGVLYVVDCGFVKQRVFDLATGLDKLVTLPISKSSAKQRAGRAGRTQPGKVYRLYTQAAFNSALFPQHDVPEICRLPLPSMMLMLLALGVTNLVQFDYFQHPPPELLSHSLEELASLGAVDITNGLLTPNLGLHVAELPLDPKLGVCLLNGVQKFACAREAIAAVAMLSLGESPFTAFSGKPRDRDNSVEEWREFTVQEGDVLSYVNALLGYQDTPAKARPQWCRLYSLDIRLLEQASRISRQLKGFVNRMGFQSSTTCGRNFELLQKCIFSGFFANAAKLDRASGQYQIIRSKTTADVHPTSIYFSQDSRPDYIIYTSAMETTKLFIRDLMSIEPEWLTEQASHYYYSVQ